jgi:hypothetical protein
MSLIIAQLNASGNGEEILCVLRCAARKPAAQGMSFILWLYGTTSQPSIRCAHFGLGAQVVP